MKSLPYIEDYIDLLGGNILTWPPREPIISLARYDKPIIESMAEQVTRGLGLTDRQSVLAHKIVVKYKKQWATAGYDVSAHIEMPRFKLPIRQIDRRRVIEISDNKIKIKFPYDQELISKLRSDINSIPGYLKWNSSSHYWESSLIEPRLIWAKEFGLSNNFEFSQSFNQIIEDILSVKDYKISLVKSDDKYTITNAEDSLLDYIENNIGFNNLISLVDYASVLGYDLDDSIVDDLKSQYSGSVIDMLKSRVYNLTFDKNIDNIKQCFEYAELTKRYPIYVYESGSKILYNKIVDCFDKQDIVTHSLHLLSDQEIKNKKVIYLTNWRNISDQMPLLITMHTLIIGVRRQQVASLAEKLIYCTQISVDEEQ